MKLENQYLISIVFMLQIQVSKLAYTIKCQLSKSLAKALKKETIWRFKNYIYLSKKKVNVKLSI